MFVVTAIDGARPVETFRAPTEYVSRSFGGPSSGEDVNRTASEHRWVVYDVDANTGKARWERVLRTASSTQPVHNKNSMASETPVTDGERVYVYLSYAGLYALDFSGNIAWSRPMDVLPVRMGWGGAASPALHDGRLYIVNDNDAQSFMAAYDARTGDELWRVARDEKFQLVDTVRLADRAADRDRHDREPEGPLVRHERQPAVGALGLTSIHAATPISVGGLLHISSGYVSDATRPVFAIRPGATGDITPLPGQRTNDYIVWSHPTLASLYPSGLVIGDQYYMLLDRGFLTATQAHTGQEVYGRQRIATDGGTFSASPWS